MRISNSVAFVIFVVQEKIDAMVFHHEGHEEREGFDRCAFQTLWPL
jgi:hypothetical protein